jgi:uncharacterized protein YbaP (TraB family)
MQTWNSLHCRTRWSQHKTSLQVFKNFQSWNLTVNLADFRIETDRAENEKSTDYSLDLSVLGGVFPASQVDPTEI